MPSNSRLQLEKWLQKIEVPKYSKVLDIGGAQKSVKGRTKTWEADEYKVLDLETPHEAREGVDIVFDIQSRLDRPAELVFEKTDFDIAFCLEVSEYWTDPMRALKNIGLMLKQDGILYISFHFIYPHHNPAGKDYLRYTRWGAQKLLEEAGFQIEEIVDRMTESSSFRAFFRGEGMRPAVADDINHEAIGWLIKCSKK